MREVMKLLKTWGGDKAARGITRLLASVRSKVAALELRLQKRREAKEAAKK